MNLILSDIHKIRLIDSGNLYDAKTKLAGQSFSRYQFNGVVFTVNDKDRFIDLKNTGKLYSVELLESKRDSGTLNADGSSALVDSLALVNFVTKQEKLEDKRFICEEESITVENFKFTSVGQLESIA